MSDTQNNLGTDIAKVVTAPANIAAWGAILCDVGVFLQTNATDSVIGWVMAGGSLIGTACAILIPALNKKRVVK